MMHDQGAEIARIGQRAAHDLGAAHRMRAVGEGDGAGFLQQADLGDLAAFEPFGDGRRRQHPHARGVAGATLEEVDDRRFVDGRIGVGRRHDRRHAAGGGRRARRRDRLAMLGAGLADEDTHVDEARGDDVARTIDDAGVGRNIGTGDRRAEIADDPVLDQHAARRLRSGGGIDEARVEEGNGAIVAHGTVLTRCADAGPGLRAPPSAPRRPFRPVR